MENLVKFNFGESQVRTINKDGEAWFVATDVCEALGIKNATQSVAVLDDDERSMFNIGRQGEVNIISESGVYCLMMRSRNAIKQGTVQHSFRKWVTSEVLPAIRKTGSYTLLVTPSQQQQIKEAVNTKVIATKSTHQAVWRSIYNQFGVAKSQQLPASQFDKVIQFLHGNQTSRPVIRFDPTLDLKYQRFLVSFNHNNEQVVQLVPHNACVLTVEDFLKRIHEPNGFMISDDALIDFSMATAQRLKERLGYYKDRKAA